MNDTPRLSLRGQAQAVQAVLVTHLADSRCGTKSERELLALQLEKVIATLNRLAPFEAELRELVKPGRGQ